MTESVQRYFTVSHLSNFAPHHHWSVWFPVSEVTSREEAAVPPSVLLPVDAAPPPASFNTNTHFLSADSAQVRHTPETPGRGGICYRDNQLTISWEMSRMSSGSKICVCFSFVLMLPHAFVCRYNNLLSVCLNTHTVELLQVSLLLLLLLLLLLQILSGQYKITIK